MVPASVRDRKCTRSTRARISWMPRPSSAVGSASACPRCSASKPRPVSMTSITQPESSSPAWTSYSSPTAAWSRTLVQASVSAISMSVRQSSATPRVCIELSSTRRTTGMLRASRGSARVNRMSMNPPSPGGVPSGTGSFNPKRSSSNADLEILDHGVGEQRRRHLLGDDRRVVPRDVELEVLALPHRRHLVETQAGQRPLDRLPLRIEDLRLEHHVDDDLGHAVTLAAVERPAGEPLVGLDVLRPGLLHHVVRQRRRGTLPVPP